MSKIRSTIAEEVLTEVEYPDFDGFKIKLAYIPREDLTKIRNRSLVRKLNKVTRQFEEEVDSDKFLNLYVEKAIKDWSGLRFKHLSQLYPANIGKANPEEEIPYTHEDAVDLMKASTIFDQFITDAMGNLETFNKKQRDEQEKK